MSFLILISRQMVQVDVNSNLTNLGLVTNYFNNRLITST